MALSQTRGLNRPAIRNHVATTQQQDQSRQPAGTRRPALFHPKAPLPNATRQQNQEHGQQGRDVAVVLVGAEMGKNPSRYKAENQPTPREALIAIESATLPIPKDDPTSAKH